jgi:hypothetical protein
MHLSIQVLQLILWFARKSVVGQFLFQHITLCLFTNVVGMHQPQLQPSQEPARETPGNSHIEALASVERIEAKFN